MSAPEAEPIICEALTEAGTHCARPARHQHQTQTGTLVMVCRQHFHVLRKRERLGSDEETLLRWGVIAPVQPPPPQ